MAVGIVGRCGQRELERAGWALELVWRFWAVFLWNLGDGCWLEAAGGKLVGKKA